VRPGGATTVRTGLRVVVLALAGALVPHGASAQLFKSEDADARRAIIELRTRLGELEQAAQARHAEAMATAQQSGALARVQLMAQFRELLATEVRQFDDTVAALRRSFLELDKQMEALRGEQAQLRGRQEQIQSDFEQLRQSQAESLRKTSERLLGVEQAQDEARLRQEGLGAQVLQAVDRQAALSERLDLQRGLFDVVEKLPGMLDAQRVRVDQVSVELAQVREDADTRLTAVAREVQGARDSIVVADGRLGGLEKRVAAQGENLGRVGDLIDRHDLRLGSLDDRFSLLDQGLRATDDRLRVVDGRVGEVDARLLVTDTRVTELDGRAAAHAERLSLLAGRADGADARMVRLDELVGVADARLGGLDARVEAGVKRADALEERAFVLGARADATDGRVQAIESRALGTENLLKSVEGRVTRADARLAEVDLRLSSGEDKAALTEGHLGDARQRIVELQGLSDDARAHRVAIDGRLGQIETHAEAASTRHLALSGRVDGVDKRVFAIDTRIGDVEGRMTAFGERVLMAAERASTSAERVTAFDTRVASVESAVGGFDDRLKALEPVAVTLDGTEFKAFQEEKRMYEDAVGHLSAAAFDRAVRGFEAFLLRYPGSGFVHAARYGLASAQFSSRSHRDAVESFRLFVAEAPDHPRASDALLAMASSQVELKDRVGARRTIENLIRRYPGSQAALLGRQRLSSLQ
jgi:tol-pal system protein YbgF